MHLAVTYFTWLILAATLGTGRTLHMNSLTAFPELKTSRYYKLAHILLVDDNPEDAHLIEIALRRSSAASNHRRRRRCRRGVAHSPGTGSLARHVSGSHSAGLEFSGCARLRNSCGDQARRAAPVDPGDCSDLVHRAVGHGACLRASRQLLRS